MKEAVVTNLDGEGSESSQGRNSALTLLCLKCQLFIYVEMSNRQLNMRWEFPGVVKTKDIHMVSCQHVDGIWSHKIRWNDQRSWNRWKREKDKELVWQFSKHKMQGRWEEISNYYVFIKSICFSRWNILKLSKSLLWDTLAQPSYHVSLSWWEVKELSTPNGIEEVMAWTVQRKEGLVPLIIWIPEFYYCRSCFIFLESKSLKTLNASYLNHHSFNSPRSYTYPAEFLNPKIHAVIYTFCLYFILYFAPH